MAAARATASGLPRRVYTDRPLDDALLRQLIAAG